MGEFVFFLLWFVPQQKLISGQTFVGGRNWGWSGLHALWLPSRPVSHWEVTINEKQKYMIRIVKIITILSPQGSGMHDWWWRGLWLLSHQASTTISLAPRRWGWWWSLMLIKNCREQLAHKLCCQVQQELAKPGQLERFLGDKPEVKINKFKTHHGFWSEITHGT